MVKSLNGLRYSLARGPTMKARGFIFASVAALAVAWIGERPIVAHHSNVAFAVETVLTATGVVKEWRWSNPHTWLIMDVDDGKGGKVEWAMEGRAPGVLLRAGWSRTVLKPGDRITVHYSPSKDGSKVGMIARVTLADGRVLPNAPPGG
jgi:hypothetical protein